MFLYVNTNGIDGFTGIHNNIIVVYYTYVYGRILPSRPVVRLKTGRDAVKKKIDVAVELTIIAKPKWKNFFSELSRVLTTHIAICF